MREDQTDWICRVTMRWTSLAVLGGLAATGSATTDASGAVIDQVKPSAENPEGCQASYNVKFQIEVQALTNETATSDEAVQKRSVAGEGALVMELKDSVLTDAQNRTGYIASNYQFQFDGPPQAGSIYTGGFCVFNNGSLALGDTTIFYRCKSGNFYNLYDRHWAPQCDAIRIQVAPLSDTGSEDQTGGHSVVGTSMVATTMVTVLPDGQPQVIQTQVPVPICQIGDGQIQAHTTPCAQAPPITSVAAAVNPVSQIADGQPQAPSVVPTAPPVSQDDDGAPLAPPPETAAPQSTASETASPEVESAPPADRNPTPTPEATSAVSPDVESVPPSEVATSSVTGLETSTRAAAARPSSTQVPEQPQAPSNVPSNSPVQAGAKMAIPGPAASLITAAIGIVVFLY
ncbi:PIR protein [Hirsutella rhossiliensis]|uniref:PIR protein n=1 Tax=Hirsutella rhossiliensis TaxID=111463 RepID=A0A9P8MP25_9HYPO|nr:PIR protein [Hirsutella rhossiliensis]KAH0957566.1 PIR protein [Hirsutella rhossiliensis]